MGWWDSAGIGYWLAVSQVDPFEQWVVLWGGFAILVLIQEDGRASQLYTELLDTLLIIDGQQEGLKTSLGLYQSHDGEVPPGNVLQELKK